MCGYTNLVIPLFEDRTGQLTRYCAAANRANELGVKDDSNELIGDEMFKNTINNFQKWGAEEMKVMLEKHDVYINSFEQKMQKVLHNIRFYLPLAAKKRK